MFRSDEVLPDFKNRPQRILDVRRRKKSKFPDPHRHQHPPACSTGNSSTSRKASSYFGTGFAKFRERIQTARHVQKRRGEILSDLKYDKTHSGHTQAAEICTIGTHSTKEARRHRELHLAISERGSDMPTRGSRRKNTFRREEMKFCPDLKNMAKRVFGHTQLAEI